MAIYTYTYPHQYIQVDLMSNHLFSSYKHAKNQSNTFEWTYFLNPNMNGIEISYFWDISMSFIGNIMRGAAEAMTRYVCYKVCNIKHPFVNSKQGHWLHGMHLKPWESFDYVKVPVLMQSLPKTKEILNPNWCINDTTLQTLYQGLQGNTKCVYFCFCY